MRSATDRETATTKPANIVSLADLAAEPRPRFTQAEGVGALVKSPGDATGLERIGVHWRSIAPGFAGTNRHFHTVEEEWAYVLAGHGVVRIGPHRLPVGPGDFVGFPPGPAAHHFIATGTESLELLEGGERRPEDDSGWYPDARRRWRAGRLVEPYVEPPPQIGSESQLVRAGSITPRRFRHDLDPAVERLMCSLHVPTGLERQAVHWVRIEADRRSTVLHTHDRTDEWVFILAGRGSVRIGSKHCEIGPGDFVGHPAGSAAHEMIAAEALTYLMGGQIDPADIVTYPEAGRIRIGRRLQPP